jgi:membrane protein required for colicin V production
MTWVDLAIVIVLAASVFGGLAQGFLRSVCSLCGLFFGLVLASWNYVRVAVILLPLVRIEPIADAIGFLLIALLVMGAANILGMAAASTVRGIGLGCLDRIAGAAFGFLQGALLVTLGILAIVAFFPQAHWLADARLPRYFFGACHLSTQLSPTELADRVRSGLRILEHDAPDWLHPQTG